ncbi:MAG: pitrilysin family protein [Bacteroidetes bacterium]|nr:pitrilysin family protein [Bacteroidota bacterium]
MKSKIISALIILFATLTANAQDVIELKMPKSNKIVIKLMFRNGSICDPKGKEGLTELTTSLITEGGTKELTHSQITDKIYPWSASYSASADKEVSIFTFEVPKVFLSQFYPIIKGLMLTPSFTQDDFDRVKSNQQNYVDQVIRASSDEEYSKKALEDFLFRGTNYQHLVSGTSQGLKTITLEDVKSHYKNFFSRSNITIGIAGDYTPDFLAKMKSDMNALSPVVPVIPAPAKAKMPDGINVEIVSKDNALGSAIFAGFPIDITRAKDDFAALMVANSWMGEHRKSYSRLYQKIREARSMNYGDYTYIEWYENGGGNMLPAPGVPRSSNYFSIWIRPVQTAKGLKGQYPELSDISIGHAHYAFRMVLREMDNLIQKGMTPESFELTRDFLRSYMKLYIQSPERQLGFLMDSHFYGRKDYIMEMDKLLAKLTVADVNTAIKKYWQTKNMDILIITDKTEAEPLAKSLRENAPSPMSYSNTLKSALSNDILEEDKVVEKYPMPVKSVKVVSSDETFRSTEATKDSKGVLKMEK